MPSRIQKKRRVQYKKSLVTYLDILGFQHLVENCPAGRVSRILRRIRDEVRGKNRLGKVRGTQFQSFSDLTVIAIPLVPRRSSTDREGLLFWELLGLVYAQVSLIKEGILIRGGMTVGLIEKSYGQLFGPALIRAYHLESKVAQYPRIVIDKVVFNELEKNPLMWVWDPVDEKQMIKCLVRFDTDKVPFIDYLGVIVDELAPREGEVPIFLNMHRKLIQQGLASSRTNRSIYTKYRWLKKYHNETVRRKVRSRFRRAFLIT